MSVGARGVFNAAYRQMLFDVTSIPFPAKGRSKTRSPRWHMCAELTIQRSLSWSLWYWGPAGC